MADLNLETNGAIYSSKGLLNGNRNSSDYAHEMGDQHVGTSLDTPMKDDAFDMSDDEKMMKIETHFKEIMDILGLDLSDDSLSCTPKRVAKMFVKDKVIGLSKLNRIVDYYSKRPQVQERLTIQIANEFKKVLGTEDVAVYIDAKHMCVQARGVRDQSSSTVTSEYGGKFLNENVKAEFLQAIRNNA